MRRALIAIALTVIAASCSGPRSGLDVGMREIDTNVLIGPARPSIVAVPPSEPAPQPIGFPGFVQPPIIEQPQPSPSPVACPAADPQSPILHEATTAATRPPLPATYKYRTSGTTIVGSSKAPLDDVTTRVVENIVNPAQGGGFTFDVTIPQGSDAKTTTTYHVYPSQSSPADAAAPGIYIEKVVTQQKGASPLTFTPTPALLLMQFPADIGATWTSRGVDPFSGTVEQFTAKIGRTVAVAACGTRLQAWKVDISDGSIQSPLGNFTFDGSIYIAPQFGGLSLRDKLVRQGSQKSSVTDPSGTPVASTLDAIIMSAPRFPR